jgi:hypothetical protein
MSLKVRFYLAFFFLTSPVFAQYSGYYSGGDTFDVYNNPDDFVLMPNKSKIRSPRNLRFEIDTLPRSFSFDTSTGIIKKISAIESADFGRFKSITLTVKAYSNNSYQRDFIIKINLKDAPPEISFSNNEKTCSINIPCSLSITNTGGEIKELRISPSLPSWLSIDPSKQLISGTPTEIKNKTTFTVTASNGSQPDSTSTFYLTVNDIRPKISYSDKICIQKSECLLSPTNTGGPVQPNGWSISPSGLLESKGLSFNTSTGNISGKPDSIFEQFFTVTASSGISLNSTSTFKLSIKEAAPFVSYVDKTCIKGSDCLISPTNTGGSVPNNGWSISPSDLLKDMGLSFDKNTGKISGKANSVSKSLLTVTATNGTFPNSESTFELTVNDIPPNISYKDMTCSKGAACTINPSNTGGAVESWAIPSSNLVSLNFTGLKFDSSSGLISGIPTNTLSDKIKVSAKNSGGISDSEFQLVINDETIVPEINYAGLNRTTTSISIPDLSFTKETPIAEITPTVKGGSAFNWKISPTLPEGLNFDTTNGKISGKPNRYSKRTQYRISASNKKGESKPTYLYITVDDLAPKISYPQPEYSLTEDTPINEEIKPEITNGDIPKFTVTPSLPSGLKLDQTNGKITGTPTNTQSAKTYKITAENSTSGKKATIDLKITISKIPLPLISYLGSPFIFTKGSIIAPIQPKSEGGNVTKWTITPSLVELFNTKTGVISGTPSASKVSTKYTIKAENSSGSKSVDIFITILEIEAPRISYSASNFEFINGDTITAILPSAEGGKAAKWTISPSLPGLSFDQKTGAISGTPNFALKDFNKYKNSTKYTVTASNSGGKSSFDLNIKFKQMSAPQVTYSPMSRSTTLDYVLEKGTEFITTPKVEGKFISWEITPATLPTGLNFDKGEIKGTPTKVFDKKSYKIIASNEGGKVETLITLKVNEIPAPQISYPLNIYQKSIDSKSSDYQLEKGKSYTITPTKIGKDIVWSISNQADLNKLGLTFDKGNISGIPILTLTKKLFTVTAQNAGGKVTSDIYITVIENTSPEKAAILHPVAMTNDTLNDTTYRIRAYNIEKDSIHVFGPYKLGSITKIKSKDVLIKKNDTYISAETEETFKASDKISFSIKTPSMAGVETNYSVFINGKETLDFIKTKTRFSCGEKFKKIFITEGLYDGNISDSICKNEAAVAQLQGDWIPLLNKDFEGDSNPLMELNNTNTGSGNYFCDTTPFKNLILYKKDNNPDEPFIFFGSLTTTVMGSQTINSNPNSNSFWYGNQQFDNMTRNCASGSLGFNTNNSSSKGDFGLLKYDLQSTKNSFTPSIPKSPAGVLTSEFTSSCNEKRRVICVEK